MHEMSGIIITDGKHQTIIIDKLAAYHLYMEDWTGFFLLECCFIYIVNSRKNITLIVNMSYIIQNNPKCATNRHPYASRTPYISTPFQTVYNSPQRVANLYPWWANQWEINPVPLPVLLYPGPQWPRGVTDTEQEPCVVVHSMPTSSLTPNWAFNK